MPKIIKNGVIATASDTFKGDIYIENGIITEIGENLNRKDVEIIDAKDNFVCPGGIDVHTHLDLDLGVAVAQDDFYTGTVAAAFGGTTCIINHLGFGPKGCDLHDPIHVYKECAKDKAVIDYAFHGVVQHINEDILKEMRGVVKEGIPSFKVYLTYDYKLYDSELLLVLAH